MLLSFRFANHRSFRDEQQLNLTPVCPADEPSGGDSAVQVASIFGANASGKSNVLHALTFMRQMATRSDREVEPGFGLAREHFRLDADSATEPSRYVVDLALDGVRHTYGFTLNSDRVVEEWLYHYPLKKRRKVFERDEDTFSWGEESGKDSALARVADITAPTALYLSTIVRFNKGRRRADSREPLHDVYRWFRAIRPRTQRVGGFRRSEGLLWPDHDDDRAVVIELLRAADVGIVDVTLEPPVLQEALFPEPTHEGVPISPSARGGRELELRSRSRLRLSHRGVELTASFNLVDESAGTQQLLGIAADMAFVLRRGGTMIVDKIDASLHPMLVAKLICLFQDRATNPMDSQLIFTSHDVALLGTFDMEEVLRRDEIWFTEKDGNGVSSLYPLSDFQSRRDVENRQRRYLSGNYGGVPDLLFDILPGPSAREGAVAGIGVRGSARCLRGDRDARG